MKHYALLFVITLFIGFLSAKPESSKPDSNFESIHHYELELYQDSLQDETQGSMPEEHTDQVRVFINATLIVVIIIILVLAVAIFLIISKVRRTRIE